MKDLVACKCGWVQFKMSAIDVALAVRMSPGTEKYYKRCYMCGGSYKNFSKYKHVEEKLFGSTIQALLDPKSKYDVVSNQNIPEGEAYLIDPNTGEILLTFTNVQK